MNERQEFLSLVRVLLHLVYPSDGSRIKSLL